MNKIRLLIADDHHMFRTAIVALLDKEPDLEVVGEANNGLMAIQLEKELSPDVVLMDIDLPKIDGFEATRRILSNHCGARVLALTSSEDEETVLKMVKAGAKGYLLKDAPMDELILAIKALSKGSSYFAKEVSNKLLALLRLADISIISKRTVSKLSLTEREFEVLQHIAGEMTNKEIAAKLFISPRTVKPHRRNLINKLKVKNTAGLVKSYLSFTQGLANGSVASTAK